MKICCRRNGISGKGMGGTSWGPPKIREFAGDHVACFPREKHRHEALTVNTLDRFCDYADAQDELSKGL